MKDGKYTSLDLRDWIGYMTLDEYKAMGKVARELPEGAVVVNIGAGAGVSGMLFAESLGESGYLYTVDIENNDSPLGSLYSERGVFKKSGLDRLKDKYWFQIHGDSKDVGLQWDGPDIDLLYVDGLHTYEGCYGDLANWYDHVKAGGIIAIHDYEKNHPMKKFVYRATNDFVEKHDSEVLFIVDCMIFLRKKMKTTWVFAAGMRRSGSAIQYHLAREVVGLAGGIDLGWLRWQDFDGAFDKNNGEYPFAVVKSHVFIPGHASRIRTRAEWNHLGSGLLIHRDIRDVLASIIRFWKANEATDHLRPESLQDQLRATYIGEGGRWLGLPNVLVTRYEDILTEDGLIKECNRIAMHLGVDISYKQCEAIALDHVIEKQRERIRNSVDKYNKDLHMWKWHIFTGKTGVWEDELTPAQIAMCDRVERMAPRALRRR